MATGFSNKIPIIENGGEISSVIRSDRLGPRVRISVLLQRDTMGSDGEVFYRCFKFQNRTI